MQNKPEQDRNQEATVYLGNLDERCTDALIWELMLQAGPVSNVFLPKDRISMQHQGFGFCEFLSEEDADYACKIMNQIKLFGKPIRVNKASYDKKQLDVGANLFIGNLDLGTDEQALYDTFSTFGAIAEQPKIARDPATGESKGYGFVSFHDFEASDMAIENMNNQFLGGKQVTVQYAFKKDGKGERHGTTAERLLAAQAKKTSGGFFGSTTPAYVAPPPPPAAAPAAVPAAPALPAGFTQANVIGAPAGAPPPPPGAPQYQQYPGYEQYYAQYGANGYAAQGGQYAQQGQGQYQQPQQQQQQQQYGGSQGGQGGQGGGRGGRGQAPPPPPPMRMGF